MSQGFSTRCKHKFSKDDGLVPSSSKDDGLVHIFKRCVSPHIFKTSVVPTRAVAEALAFAQEIFAKGQVPRHYFTEMCSGSEAGSYLRLIDFRITQL